MFNLTPTFKSSLAASACVAALTSSSYAASFNIPGGDLATALNRYTLQSGVAVFVSGEVVRGAQTRGVKGDLTADAALTRLLSGTGFSIQRDPSGAVAIVPGHSSSLENEPLQLAQANPVPRASVETVTVTSSKLGGADVQSIPIAITALSQEQLTATQTAGGPDLVKQVPNLTFTKTNFTGYSIQIRGIGTQAISVATDPAVAVAFNDTPFIRNHFFEQEFYDLSQLEVLRGPQGTLYGRNATAGVVNITSAKPTDQFEAMASGDIGNYKNRRFEGMINIPLDSDKLGLRVAGEWTKRDGYTLNETTGEQTDGRDLWSGRVTVGWKPVSTVQTYLVWEHFQEDDDRLRSSKQLCKTDPGLSNIDGVSILSPRQSVFTISSATFSQGCLPSSLYAPEAFGVPNGYSLPFVSGAAYEGFLDNNKDPYLDTTQPTNLRNIQSALQPKYLAKNDTLQFNATWNVSPSLSVISDTAYNRDFLWSSEDYNRFDTTPGIFLQPDGTGGRVVCDPQLGCSNRLVVQDLATEKSWQFSQELRVVSNLQGPLNFSVGGNYLHYETDEKYYVFSNTFSLLSLNNVCPDNNGGLIPGGSTPTTSLFCLANGRSYNERVFRQGGGIPTETPQYVDPNPLNDLDSEGHNYFLSNNPYLLNSYAAFGEAYYNITSDLKLTGGLRWTDDQKHFIEIPSELLTLGYGYPSSGVVDQSWSKFTGRAVANWSPKLAFTDQSLFYASFAHGYKAGGANPPGPVLIQYTDAIPVPVHPLTFKPEYVNAFELGTKNTLLDGGLTLNGDVFYYDYKGYQISQIVDRSAVNSNFDATIRGAEIEATWEPVPGLKFSFAGGYEQTRIDNNQFAIDLVNRTAGTPGWVVMKPWVGQSSNCIFPAYVAAALSLNPSQVSMGGTDQEACSFAYHEGIDPVTSHTYQYGVENGLYPKAITGPDGQTFNYIGFDPSTAPNAGQGFAQNLGGNELPNAPHYTVSLGADYTLPVSPDWAATLHSDFYWQANSWARVQNDDPFDRIRGYTNVNLALILTDQSGWQVMGYVKNVFDTTAITGTFLNSDDSGLTTNIFLTDPRLFGVRVTKHFDGGGLPGGGALNFAGDGAARPQVWLQLGGNFDVLNVGQQPYAPAFAEGFPDALPSPVASQRTPNLGLDWEGKAKIQPENTDWVLTAGIRYGRTSRDNTIHKSLPRKTQSAIYISENSTFPCSLAAAPSHQSYCTQAAVKEFSDVKDKEVEHHTMIDFTLGKDVGLGLFGAEGSQTIAGGVRIAEFGSRNAGRFNSIPGYEFHGNPFTQKYHTIYNGVTDEARSFHGIGPELSWEASQPAFGEQENGQVSMDFGVNISVLFGRQKANIHHESTQCTAHLAAVFAVGCHPTLPPQIQTFSRSRSVTVPNLGGHIGASVLYRNAKVSFGYRADTFFGAMDGGQDTAKSYSRGFYGPYLNVSLGLGG